LTELLRDAAAARLAAALPHLGEDIERALIGRAVEGQAPLQPEQRVRIVPLPSIGHPQADRAVRRFMVDVPSANPLRAGDVFWAFSGLEFRTPSNAEAVVTRTDDRRMLEHYGAGGAPFVRWRTVTAAALPIARRRIDPTRRSEEAKSASERASEEARAGRAVLQALRHAGVRTAVERVQVQREPFVAKGARAEAFGPGTRFRKERLWHVDLTFCDPVGGPLVIGDGRFLGLGIMECVEEYPHAWAFRVREGLAKNAPPVGIAEAVRRAVMARFQRQIGETESLPAYVSGHDAKGNPAADTARLSFAYDPESERLLVIPPHTLRHRRPRENERRHLRTLASALAGFTELRAGTAGLLVLQPVPLDTDNDPLFACGHHWVSRTPYTVNRHLARDDAHAALTADLEAAVRGAGMPRAKINVRHAWSVRGIGLMGLAELEFDVAVHGPVVLGRTRFKGGGLFAASDEALSR
jgi:CRISPR-associated protein Csb2